MGVWHSTGAGTGSAGNGLLGTWSREGGGMECEDRLLPWLLGTLHYAGSWGMEGPSRRDEGLRTYSLAVL